MLKKYIVLGACAVLLGACSKQETVLPLEEPAPEGTVPVELSVAIAPGQLQNTTGYEPMSRVEWTNPDEVKASIYNDYLCLIMKKIDGNWVVERRIYPRIDPSKSNYTNHEVKDQLPENKLRIDLTPGDYKMTVVLNYRAGKDFTQTNNIVTKEYQVGQVVLAPGAPESELPQLIGYLHLGPQYGSSFKAEEILYNEIFAGTADFTVVKTTGLEPTGTPLPVSVETKRKVGSFRVYLKETGVDPDFGSGIKTYLFFGLTAANGARFVEGLNAWGDPYYGDTPLTHMDGSFVNTEAYIPTAEGNFKIPARNGSRWFGHYYFTDPAVTEGIPYTFHDFEANEVSGSTNWYYEGGPIPRVLYHNQQDAIAFEALGGVEERQIWTENGTQTEYVSTMDLVRDSGGNPINAADLFSPNFDWNTNIQ